MTPDFGNVAIYIWFSLVVLILGSIYLIVEGYKVNKIFSESIVGRLVKTLVVVLLIEIYSLGIVCYTLLNFSPKGSVVLLPIMFLWIISLVFAIVAVRGAKREVTKLVK